MRCICELFWARMSGVWVRRKCEVNVCVRCMSFRLLKTLPQSLMVAVSLSVFVRQFLLFDSGPVLGASRTGRVFVSPVFCSPEFVVRPFCSSPVCVARSSVCFARVVFARFVSPLVSPVVAPFFGFAYLFHPVNLFLSVKKRKLYQNLFTTI